MTYTFYCKDKNGLQTYIVRDCKNDYSLRTFISNLEAKNKYVEVYCKGLKIY